MPIYEYECKKCHTDFEELVFGSEEGIHCPHCKSKGVKRLMSAAAFKCNGNFVSTASSGGGCSGCSSHSCSTCK
jgi:putative FmdB family regulatory protein